MNITFLTTPPNTVPVKDVSLTEVFILDDAPSRLKDVPMVRVCGSHAVSAIQGRDCVVVFNLRDCDLMNIPQVQLVQVLRSELILSPE